MHCLPDLTTYHKFHLTCHLKSWDGHATNLMSHMSFKQTIFVDWQVLPNVHMDIYRKHRTYLCYFPNDFW